MLALAKNIAFATGLLIVALAPQASSLDPTSVAQLATQVGLGGAMLWVWWKTFQQSAKEQKSLRNDVSQAIDSAMSETRDMHRSTTQRQNRRDQELMNLLREQHETNRRLTGVLSRLESNVDQINRTENG